MSVTRRAGWIVAAAVVVVVCFAATRWFDARLAEWQPDALSAETWLWLRWVISFSLAFALAAGFRKGARAFAAQPRFVPWVPLIACVLFVAVPTAIAGYHAQKRHPEPVPHADLHGVTQLDVVIAARRSTSTAVGPPPPPPLDRTPWDTRWSVALVARGGTRVVLDATREREAVVEALTGLRDDDARRVAWRARARHLLLIDPHAMPIVVAGGGVPPPKGARLSLPDGFAARANALGRPHGRTLVLLLASDEQAAQKRWRRWAVAHHAGVVLIGDHGAETLADVGWRAAVAPGADTDDAALAWRFRPYLLFHSQAPKREGAGYFPMNVDDFLATRRPSMCRQTTLGESCRHISRGEQLDGSYDFLDTGATHSNPAAKAPLPPTTAGCGDLPAGIPPPPPCVMSSPIYWFIRHHGRDIYIGYWWFFPFNPTPVFRRSTCGPFAGLPDLDCFDHASDWEGVTVVVPRPGTPGVAPVAVIYEQHGEMLRRSWPWLLRYWGKRARGERALVFVASGSHASYPTPCHARYCRQRPLNPKLPDGPHDGLLEWPNNADSRCQGVCLLRMPVTAEGEPALWAAFPGRWGRRICILWDAFCTQTTAPESPGPTDRFVKPWEARTNRSEP